MKEAAEVLINNKFEILNLWESRVKEVVEASKATSKIALRDHLPTMIENIASIFERHEHVQNVRQQERYLEIIGNSSNHGRHRASSENYTVDQIIHEYIIFHRILTIILLENKTYDAEVADLLKYIIETAMLQSASSFTISLQEMQEKLIGTLAHDIRNPLSVAISALEILNKDYSDEMFESVRNMAVRNIHKSVSLTEGLLDAISVKAGEGIMLDFRHVNLVEDIQWIFKEACEIYSQEIKIECDHSEINGFFDGVAVRRLLENLITNAVKYGDKSRSVTIIVRDEKDHVVLGVHNYGNPIPQEKQQSIFDFLNHDEDDNKNGGMQSWGMGLTLVKIVAEAHGGRVALESDETNGTSFKAYLSKKNKEGKKRARLNNHMVRDEA